MSVHFSVSGSHFPVSFHLSYFFFEKLDSLDNVATLGSISQLPGFGLYLCSDLAGLFL